MSKAVRRFGVRLMLEPRSFEFVRSLKMKYRQPKPGQDGLPVELNDKLNSSGTSDDYLLLMAQLPPINLKIYTEALSSISHLYAPFDIAMTPSIRMTYLRTTPSRESYLCLKAESFEMSEIKHRLIMSLYRHLESYSRYRRQQNSGRQGPLLHRFNDVPAGLKIGISMGLAGSQKLLENVEQDFREKGICQAIVKAVGLQLVETVNDSSNPKVVATEKFDSEVSQDIDASDRLKNLMYGVDL